MLSRLFRYFYKLLNSTKNKVRKIKLKILFPGVFVDRGTFIEDNCKIICVDGGKLILKNCHISSGTHIFVDSNGLISIDSSFIGRNSIIVAKNLIRIEKNVSIAEMVVIRDQDHAIDELGINPGFPNFRIAPIIIEEHSWIASKATILKGVTIGKNALVGASAVVTKNIPNNETWIGLPAKPLK